MLALTPASQGEWVKGAGRAVSNTGYAWFDKLEFVGLFIDSELTLASSSAIFLWSSLSPARTAASSEVTSGLILTGGAG